MPNSSFKRLAPWVAAAVLLVGAALYFFFGRRGDVAPPPSVAPTASVPARASSPPARASVAIAPPPAPMPVSADDLTIGTLTPPGFAELPQLAKTKGYFDAEGLHVKIERIQQGGDVAQGVTERRFHLGLTFDFSIAFAAFGSPGFVVLARVAHADRPITVYARKDRGIAVAGDLKGKRIGIQVFPNSHYFLSLYLARHGMSEADVTVVEQRYDQLQGSLARGDIDALADAVASLRGAGSNLLKKPGLELTDLSEASVCPIGVGLIASDELVKKHPKTVERFMRAIVKANAFLNEHHDEAVDQIAEAVAAEGGQVRKLIDALSYEVALDPSFVSALQSRGRWFQEAGRNKTDGGVPDYESLIYADALRKVEPKAVTLPR